MNEIDKLTSTIKKQFNLYQMNTRTLLLSIFILIIISSCKKDDNSTEEIPRFAGITIRQSELDEAYYFDVTDWRIDDKFTELESSLFDTIKFDNTLHLKRALSDSITVPVNRTPAVSFYPNPPEGAGKFKVYGMNAISNIVIVDQSFNILTKLRETYNEIAIDFSSYEKGYYRMYYVLQNSNFAIIGLGHGDIYIGDIEDLIFTTN